MTLKLYLHPLSSYCHKALIAFYENDIPFEAKRVDDANVAAEFRKLWPIGRFPLLRDDSRDATVPESTIIIEYLALHYPGKTRLVPDDPDAARKVRMRDRFFDNYLHTCVQKFAFDRLRPEDKRDAYGVDEAKAMYAKALDLVETAMAGSTWVMGDEFTMADCAAAPALFYGNRFFGPFRPTHGNAAAYLDRLMARPSYARALKEAEPYMHLLPK
ncbi:MAG TPA: glutathione S-transferase family protein [Steroidobacteraceae bacterium]|nr:glutathione S-transferase family protein [Steroidobacteraceae bacterium]